MSWRCVRGAGRGSTHLGGLAHPGGCCKGGACRAMRPWHEGHNVSTLISTPHASQHAAPDPIPRRLLRPEAAKQE